MELIKEQVVIVMDTSNYKSEYSNDDEVPFKATVEATYSPNLVVVTSNETLKKYELYDYQILECFKEDAIKEMVSVQKWSEDGGQKYETEPKFTEMKKAMAQQHFPNTPDEAAKGIIWTEEKKKELRELLEDFKKKVNGSKNINP